MLFLVPLVALAVQKHQRFAERYGPFAKASLQIGAGGSAWPRTAVAAPATRGHR